MLSGVKKKKKKVPRWHILRCHTTLGLSAGHASLFPCLMQHIQSDLMTPPNGCYWRSLEDGCQRNRIKWRDSHFVLAI